jgi:hypothetical protein
MYCIMYSICIVLCIVYVLYIYIKYKLLMHKPQTTNYNNYYNNFKIYKYSFTSSSIFSLFVPSIELYKIEFL